MRDGRTLTLRAVCLLAPLLLGGCIAVVHVKEKERPDASLSPRDERVYRIPRRTRTFEFVYRASATPPEGSSLLRMWLPLPRSDGLQQVLTTRTSILVGGRAIAIGSPTASVVEEPVHGNRTLRVTSPGEPVEVELRFEVTRGEHLVKDFRDRGSRPLNEAERRRFAADLAADAMVPIDGVIAERALRVVGAASNVLVQGRLLYDDVLEDMRYDKTGTGWGRGDAVWACDARFGNCTDFHSVFNGMVRSLGIPARFAMGFPLPPEHGEGTIGGYHCWASFYVPDYGWIPVDISEADKHPELAEYYFGAWTEDRVEFTRGRDLVLPGMEAGVPLNFFVYPYLEIDGKDASEIVTREFRFRDLGSGDRLGE
jgi:transglutaminase-like putative cysteine protease